MTSPSRSDPGQPVAPLAITVNLERPEDLAAVDRINEVAFGRRAEPDLVAALRREERDFISLVAAHGDTPIGHITFSPAHLVGGPDLRISALAPMGVLPEYQGRGVGSALVRAGLASCRERGFAAAVVLGHPSYYPRFGFSPGAHRGLRCEYDVPEEAFLTLELRRGALAGRSGLVRYARAFEDL